MVGLFLVEDEIVMRQGIKRRIDWESEGIEFMGEASDGELALPLILEKKPDIVITDIKMPFMDGLTLSKHIKEELPKTRIIILSGYDEFEYARDAIKLGVTEYLLKPIAPQALLESIRGVVKDILKEKEEEVSESKTDYETKELEALNLFSELAKHILEKPEREGTSGDAAASRNDNSEKVDVADAGRVSDKELVEFLKTGSLDATDEFIENLFSSIGEHNAKSLIFLNYITMNMYFTMVRFLKELGEDAALMTEQCGDINDIINSMTDISQARTYLSSCLSYTINARDKGSGNKYARLIKDAITYIDSHFSDEELSLNTLASLTNTSPNHFSSVFSQEMGQTFIEYLINKRMEKAKELLMTTDLKSFEIAYRVGYRDPHYFSSTFKKTQGMTVREFRARGRGEI